MRRLTLLAAVALLIGGAAQASAHVDVLPTEVAQGEPLEFTVRVPTERQLPTTRVRVEFPSQITVYSFAAPPPGWTMRPVRCPTCSTLRPKTEAKACRNWCSVFR